MLPRDILAAALIPFRARGGLVAFDTNYRPVLWPDVTTARAQMIRFLELTDIAFPSRDTVACLDAAVSLAERVVAAHGAILPCGAACLQERTQ
jgi:2-dehydro-3-deoxygluconokinase